VQGPINLGKVMSLHAKFKRAHYALFDKEVESAGKFGVQHVHLYPTFKRRTGNLQNSTEHRILRTKSGSIIRLANKAKYARFVEFGTKAHGPRRARFMRFVGRNGGIVFARRVRGIKPYKFLYRATTAAGRVFEMSMGAGMNRIAKQF
jgi:hypothetical protein